MGHVEAQSLETEGVIKLMGGGVSSGRMQG